MYINVCITHSALMAYRPVYTVSLDENKKSRSQNSPLNAPIVASAWAKQVYCCY